MAQQPQTGQELLNELALQAAKSCPFSQPFRSFVS